jgi:hypothetical protein
MDDIGQRIISTVKTLRLSMPSQPALTLLDMALTPHQGTEPDFSTDTPWGDAGDPRTVFGALIYAAFSSQPIEGRFMPAEVDEAGELTSVGEELVLWALKGFATRYRLWSGDPELIRARWLSACLDAMRRHRFPPDDDLDEMLVALSEDPVWVARPPAEVIAQVALGLGIAVPSATENRGWAQG